MTHTHQAGCRHPLPTRRAALRAGAVGLFGLTEFSALRALVHLARVQGLVPWTLEVAGVTAEPYRDTRGPGHRGVRALLDEVAAAATPKQLRDWAFVRLMTDLALRRGEVVALDLEDLDFAAGAVSVLGKGKRGKTKITLPEQTRAALTAWVAARGAPSGPASEPVSSATPGRGVGRGTRPAVLRAAQGRLC